MLFFASQAGTHITRYASFVLKLHGLFTGKDMISGYRDYPRYGQGQVITSFLMWDMSIKPGADVNGGLADRAWAM